MKQAAREAGITLDELARAIGCSRALIYQYASGASLAQTDRLQQIAGAVGKPLDWFFTDGAGAAEARSAGASGETSAEREQIQSEWDSIAAERVRAEQRRAADDIARLEALLAAYSTPANSRKVVDCCHQLTPLLERDANTQRLAAILLQQGNALIQLQEWGAAKEQLEQAGTLYRAAGEQAAARDCMQSLGHVNLMLGRVEEALQQFEYVSSGEDWANRWQGALSVGACHEVLGSYPDAISAFEKALEVVEERGDDRSGDIGRLYIEANWSNLELNFGDFASAALRSDRCISSALRLGVQDQYMEALLTSGAAQLYSGKVRDAARTIRLALDVADLTADQQHRSLALSYLSLCDSAMHRTAEAISAGKEALALALRSSAVRAEIAAQRALSEAYLLDGNAREALYHAQQGLLVSTNIRLRLPQAQFAALKARALLIVERSAEARLEAERGLALALELHARPVQLDCLVVSAQGALKDSDAAAAADRAAQATDLAAALGSASGEWRSAALAAQAAVQMTRLEDAREPLKSAIDRVNAVRLQQREECGLDTILEDPIAFETWQLWLRLLLETEGRDSAVAAAQETDWPPLIEWLNETADVQKEDGGADV